MYLKSGMTQEYEATASQLQSQRVIDPTDMGGNGSRVRGKSREKCDEMWKDEARTVPS